MRSRETEVELPIKLDADDYGEGDDGDDDAEETLPRSEGFTLRRVATKVPKEDALGRGGLFGLVNSLELRLQQMSEHCSKVGERCGSLFGQHKQLAEEVTTRRKGRRLWGARSPPPGAEGAPSRAGVTLRGGGAEELQALPRKEQRLLADLDEKLTRMEQRILRDVRGRRVADVFQGRGATVLFWLLRLAGLAACVVAMWLHGACAQYLPPPAWA